MSERLSHGRCGDPRHTALMRRLNESASWLSDVSALHSEDELQDSSTGEGGPQKSPYILPVGGKSLCLAEMLNESATWIECDISGSEDEDYPVELENPATNDFHQYRDSPAPHAGGVVLIGRSYSC